MRIRRLSFEDLSDVLVIERVSFTSPWSLTMFMLELAKPSSICLAAVDSENNLAGYLVCSRYADIWHIMNVSVAPHCRRQGIATQLLKQLFELTEQRSELVQYTLEVRASNSAVIEMYLGLGFELAGRRRGYYQNDGEDAVVMWRSVEAGTVLSGVRHHELAGGNK